MLLSNCNIWSLQNQHSRKQQNLGYFSYEEKAIHWCSSKYRFTFFFMWPLISPSNSKSLSVVWGLTKNSVSLYVLKDFFTVSRYVLKISTAKYIFKVFVFSNFDLWSIANRFLWKQKNLFLRPNQRNPQLIE